MAYRDIEEGRRDITIDSLSDFNTEFVKKQSRGTDKINISFDLNIYDYEIGKRMYAFIMEVKNYGYDVSVSIKTDNHNFSLTNMLQFKQIKEHLAKRGVKFYYDGGLSKEYDSKEVYLAQAKLRNLVARIEEGNLSPLEKYLYLYDFLIEKIYKENQEDASKARDIISVLTSDYIVCSGYAKLMERICKEVGIECKVQQCSIKGSNGESYNHENNIVRIDDDKYNIHGWFYSDACWDHVDEKTPNKKTFAFCLIPLTDKDKMKHNQITVNDDCLFYYDDEQSYFKLVDGDYYGSTFGIDYQTGDYSKIIKDLGLEQRYKIEEERVKNVYDNTFVRLDAMNRLRKMFQQNNIPSDIYSKKSEVPYGCSLEFLIALCMQRNNDFLVNEKIKELKKYYESEETLSFEDSARTFTENVYDEISSMIQNVENYQDDFKWQCVDQKLVKMIMANRVRTCLEADGNRPGKAIPYEAFKKAMIKAISQKKIAKNEAIAPIVNCAMEETVHTSENIYNENASNCFREEALYKTLCTMENV